MEIFSTRSRREGKIVSEVDALKPVSVTASKIRILNEAWRVCFKALREKVANGGISIPRDEDSYQARKKLWDETVKEMRDRYPEMTEIHDKLLINLRSRAEFGRLMYQFASMKQFARDEGYDFAEPGKFILDYEEDGEFAKNLWLCEYVPGLMDVVNDVLKPSGPRRSKRELSKIRKGRVIVLDLLKHEKKAKTRHLTSH